jgi:hypothetical protein
MCRAESRLYQQKTHGLLTKRRNEEARHIRLGAGSTAEEIREYVQPLTIPDKEEKIMKRTALMVALALTCGGWTAAEARKLQFDVAEVAHVRNADGSIDPTRSKFVFDETPSVDNLPAYGTEFVSQGVIYEYGTLTCGENGCNGVNPDGTPEFPDKILGTWTCRGWFIGQGAKTTTGPWVITTQVYDFGTTPGREMLVSDGSEIADLNTPIARALTGGTGRYSKARGEITQTMLGFNVVEGVALRFQADVK